MEKPGIHIIGNFFGCEKNTELLVDKPKLMKFLSGTVKKNGMNVLNESFYKFPGEDSGITGFLLLAESHVSIHTWPERDNYFAMDIFVCNYTKDNTEGAKKIFEEIVEFFKPNKLEKEIVYRH